MQIFMQLERFTEPEKYIWLMEFLAASDNISSYYETFFKCLKIRSLSMLKNLNDRRAPSKNICSFIGEHLSLSV